MAAAEEASLRRQRSTRTDIFAVWRELVAARRSTVILATAHGSRAVARQVIAMWRCGVQVPFHCRAGGLSVKCACECGTFAGGLLDRHPVTVQPG